MESAQIIIACIRYPDILCNCALKIGKKSCLVKNYNIIRVLVKICVTAFFKKNNNLNVFFFYQLYILFDLVICTINTPIVICKIKCRYLYVYINIFLGVCLNSSTHKHHNASPCYMGTKPIIF